MMVDTDHVLEQLRAANPAPSLELLAVADLDRVRNIVAGERSGVTAPVKEQPQTSPDRLIPRPGLHPVLVAGLAFLLALGTLGTAVLLFRGFEAATAPFTCPPGSTPDQSGPTDQPRPRFLFSDSAVTFDPTSGRALLLNEPGLFWMFDVCTNTWTAGPRPGKTGFDTWTATPEPGQIGLAMDFVYDVDSDRAIVFAEDRAVGAQVWAYMPDGQVWIRKSNLAVGPALFQAVYDSETGLVVVRATTSKMWTYDVDTDTWTEVDQGANLPPAAEDREVQLLTYDASANRLILYVIDDSEDSLNSGISTWEFDIRAGRWEQQTTNTPKLFGGWGPGAEEFVYDEANQVSVIYGTDASYVATYDASEHSWTELHSGQTHRFPGNAITYDSVNERILVFDTSDEYGVIAFDAATGDWITLLEPTTE